MWDLTLYNGVLIFSLVLEFISYIQYRTSTCLLSEVPSLFDGAVITSSYKSTPASPWKSPPASPW